MDKKFVNFGYLLTKKTELTLHKKESLVLHKKSLFKFPQNKERLVNAAQKVWLT